MTTQTIFEDLYPQKLDDFEVLLNYDQIDKLIEYEELSKNYQEWMSNIIGIGSPEGDGYGYQEMSDQVFVENELKNIAYSKTKVEYMLETIDPAYRRFPVAYFHLYYLKQEYKYQHHYHRYPIHCY